MYHAHSSSPARTFVCLRMGYRISSSSFKGPYYNETGLREFTEQYNWCEICNLFFVHPRVDLPGIPAVPAGTFGALRRRL